MSTLFSDETVQVNIGHAHSQYGEPCYWLRCESFQAENLLLRRRREMKEKKLKIIRTQNTCWIHPSVISRISKLCNATCSSNDLSAGHTRHSHTSQWIIINIFVRESLNLCFHEKGRHMNMTMLASKKHINTQIRRPFHSSRCVSNVLL